MAVKEINLYGISYRPTSPVQLHTETLILKYTHGMFTVTPSLTIKLPTNNWQTSCSIFWMLHFNTHSEISARLPPLSSKTLLKLLVRINKLVSTEAMCPMLQMRYPSQSGKGVLHPPNVTQSYCTGSRKKDTNLRFPQMLLVPNPVTPHTPTVETGVMIYSRT